MLQKAQISPLLFGRTWSLPLFLKSDPAQSLGSGSWLGPSVEGGPCWVPTYDEWGSSAGTAEGSTWRGGLGGVQAVKRGSQPLKMWQNYSGILKGLDRKITILLQIGLFKDSDKPQLFTHVLPLETYRYEDVKQNSAVPRSVTLSLSLKFILVFKLAFTCLSESLEFVSLCCTYASAFRGNMIAHHILWLLTIAAMLDCNPL